MKLPLSFGEQKEEVADEMGFFDCNIILSLNHIDPQYNYLYIIYKQFIGLAKIPSGFSIISYGKAN